MKLFVICLLLVAITSVVDAQSLYPRPVKVNGLWGYIDNSGKTVIEASFNRADEFSEGLAYVQRGSQHFFISPSGQTAFVLPDYMEVSGLFSSGLILFSRTQPTPQDAPHCGFVDKSGEISITLDSLFCIESLGSNFSVSPRFSGELANVGTSFIDLHGQPVSPTPFQKTWPVSDGLGLFEISGHRYGFISTTTRAIAIDAVYTAAEPFSEGLAAVRFERLGTNHSGFIDKTGKIVIEAKRESWKAEVDNYNCGAGSAFHNGLSTVQVQDDPPLASYIDKKGVIKVPGKFLQACPFSNGVALVMVDFNSGAKLINRLGATVATVPGVEEFLHPFMYGLAKVEFSSTDWGYVNLKGKVVWESH